MFYKSVLYRCINVIFKWLTSKDFTKKKNMRKNLTAFVSIVFFI